MNELIEKYFKVTIVAVLLIFAYAALGYVDSYSRSIEPSAFRSFSASGEGKITAIPDIAQFNFSVITEGGKDIAKIQKENTEKTNKIIDFIKSNDIENKDIKTLNYNLEPKYQYYDCGGAPLFGAKKPCPPPEISGYAINQTVSVKIRDFSKIGDILGGVVANGANSVSQLSFEIDDADKIKNLAREEAIKKANEKAKAMAKAGNFRLGKLLSIDEGGFTPMPYYLKTMEASSVVGISSSPNIEPGSQEIVINITLRYEIK